MNIFKTCIGVSALLSLITMSSAQVVDKKSLAMDGARKVIAASVAAH